MKKFIYLLVLFLISTNFYSQQRTNGEQLKFESIGKSLDNATGWRYDDLQSKWIETKRNENFGENNSSTVSFYEIFFTKIKYNELTYFILNINYLDGAYKYPNIKQGFYTYNVIRSYIFSENDFLNMKNYGSGITNNYSFNTLIDAKKVSDKGIEDLRLNTIAALKSNSKSSYSKFEMKIKKEDDKTVRFILPFKTGEDFLSKSWGFDKQYFEVEKEKIDIIFNL